MPKQNIHTPPPTRDPIITCCHANASTLGEQVAQVLDNVLVTSVQEQATPSDRYVLISQILGPITVEQLLKGNSHNVSKIRIRFTKEHPTQYPTQNDNQDSLSPSDQNAERRRDIFNEPSTPGIDLGSMFQDSATPWHSIQA